LQHLIPDRPKPAQSFSAGSAPNVDEISDDTAPSDMQHLIPDRPKPALHYSAGSAPNVDEISEDSASSDLHHLIPERPKPAAPFSFGSPPHDRGLSEAVVHSGLLHMIPDRPCSRQPPEAHSWAAPCGNAVDSEPAAPGASSPRHSLQHLIPDRPRAKGEPSAAHPRLVPGSPQGTSDALSHLIPDRLGFKSGSSDSWLMRGGSASGEGSAPDAAEGSETSSVANDFWHLIPTADDPTPRLTHLMPDTPATGGARKGRGPRACAGVAAAQGGFGSASGQQLPAPPSVAGGGGSEPWELTPRLTSFAPSDR